MALVVAAFMSRVKTGRSIKVEALCDFSEAEPTQNVRNALNYFLVGAIVEDGINVNGFLLQEMESDGTTKCLEGQLQSEPIAATNKEDVESKSSSIDLPGNQVLIGEYLIHFLVLLSRESFDSIRHVQASVLEEQGKIDCPDAGLGAR